MGSTLRSQTSSSIQRRQSASVSRNDTIETGLDLVDIYRLRSTIEADVTIHETLYADPSRGLRKAKKIEYWKKDCELGQGGFGTVWLERERHQGKVRAVKEIRKHVSEKERNEYLRELLAMAFFSKDQSNFPELFGWFENGPNIRIAMEYFPLRDLSHCLSEPVSEAEAKSITFQITEALDVIHRRNITHRDLKPQNVFVVRQTPEWWVKLGDFGISKRVQDNDTSLYTQYLGLYVAPEVNGLIDFDEDEEDAGVYTSAVDVWSLGCLVHWLLTLQPPFVTIKSLYRYCSGKIPLSIGQLQDVEVSEAGIRFISRCLSVRHGERPTAAEALESGWLSALAHIMTLDETHTSSVSVEEPTTVRYVEAQSYQYRTVTLDGSNDTHPMLEYPGTTNTQSSSLNRQELSDKLAAVLDFGRPSHHRGTSTYSIESGNGSNETSYTIVKAERRLSATTGAVMSAPIPVSTETARSTTKSTLKKSPPLVAYPEPSMGYPGPKRSVYLPPPDELLARITEGKTTAELLVDLIESMPQKEVEHNGLVAEFYDRVKSASRSLKSYRQSLDPYSDYETWLKLADACAKLKTAEEAYRNVCRAGEAEIGSESNGFIGGDDAKLNLGGSSTISSRGPISKTGPLSATGASSRAGPLYENSHDQPRKFPGLESNLHGEPIGVGDQAMLAASKSTRFRIASSLRNKLSPDPGSSSPVVPRWASGWPVHPPQPLTLPEIPGNKTPQVFGVTLDASLDRSKVSIALYNRADETFVLYGYVPMVVSVCGLFLKENPSFPPNREELEQPELQSRVEELQARYEEMEPYQRVDRSMIDDSSALEQYLLLYRYLKNLKNPVIPHLLLDGFASLAYSWSDSITSGDFRRQESRRHDILLRLQTRIDSLPRSNRHLLLYLADLVRTLDDWATYQTWSHLVDILHSITRPSVYSLTFTDQRDVVRFWRMLISCIDDLKIDGADVGKLQDPRDMDGKRFSQSILDNTRTRFFEML